MTTPAVTTHDVLTAIRDSRVVAAPLNVPVDLSRGLVDTGYAKQLLADRLVERFVTGMALRITDHGRARLAEED